MAACGFNIAADSLVKLPKIRCPRGGGASPEESPKLKQTTPRTPRGREGWISAGAALALFFRSPQTSPRVPAAPLHPGDWTAGAAGATFYGGLSSFHSPTDTPRVPASALGPSDLFPTGGGGGGFGGGGYLQPPSPPLSNGTPRLDAYAVHSSLAWLSPATPSTPRLNTGHPQLSAALSSLLLHSDPLRTAGRSHNVGPTCALGGGSIRDVRARSGDGRTSAEASVSGRNAVVENSPSANDDLLLFFYQMDLSARLQRALNLDQYEPAQQIREKIAEVDKEIARLRDEKLGGVSAKEDAQDKGITLLSLKAELAKAVEEEQYAAAAELRNKIAALEAETLAASAAALAAKNREFVFRLGQRVRHKEFGYFGLVAGMDPVCCESKEWRETSGLTQHLLAQPFYQVLVDVKAGLGFPVAYVSESSLEELQEPIRDRFDHPYIYLLFYGMDANGDFIPCQQLREKYNASRHEVPLDTDNGGEPKGGDKESS